MGLRVRIPLREMMFVCYMFVVCCAGNGLCDGLITHSGQSYSARARACVCVCVFVRVLGTSTVRRSGAELGL